MQLNYHRFINKTSAARKELPIRAATAIVLNNPDILSLAPGWPNSNMFPFESAQFKTADGMQISYSGDEMKRILQYSASKGDKPLLEWTRKLQKYYHNPPLMSDSRNADDGFDVCITNGSQDAVSKIIDMVGSSGDSIIMENPSYSGAYGLMRPKGLKLVPIETDKHGMKPDSLRQHMQKWSVADIQNANSDIPKLIYIVPSCANPTGVSISLARKKEIYEIAQKYDMLIIEDDPYFFLQFGDRIPSFQSLDTDGRVLRCDSTSKVISPGLRIGWVSGAKPFIKRIIMHQQCSIVHCNTMAQAMVTNLLDKWEIKGFENHIKRVREFYQSQRDAMVRCLDKRLKGLAEWNVPDGGMFVWIKFLGIEDSNALIMKKALEKKVMLIPGSAFEVEEGTPSPYCRASYSFATEDIMDEAFRRVAEIIEEELESK